MMAVIPLRKDQPQEPLRKLTVSRIALRDHATAPTGRSVQPSAAVRGSWAAKVAGARLRRWPPPSNRS